MNDHLGFKKRCYLSLDNYLKICLQVCLFKVRDSTVRKAMGGGGDFRAAGLFFSLSNSLYEFFFKPQHKYFLGLIGVHEFFSLNFLLREYVLVLRPPPPPTPISFLMVRPSPRRSRNGPLVAYESGVVGSASIAQCTFFCITEHPSPYAWPWLNNLSK